MLRLSLLVMASEPIETGLWWVIGACLSPSSTAYSLDRFPSPTGSDFDVQSIETKKDEAVTLMFSSIADLIECHFTTPLQETKR